MVNGAFFIWGEMSNRTTWPLWECLKPEQLAGLIMLQWKLYGTRLELLTRADFSGVESLKEIDRLMRIPTKRSRPIK